MPYLMNSIAYDHDFWYTCVKWWYIHVLFFFSIFQNFDFAGCYGGKRAKNGPKWQSILSVMLHISEPSITLHVLEPYIIWLSFMVYMGKLILSLGAGFELSVLQSRNAIYFSIITMPKKSHFTIFAIQNFVSSTKKCVNSIYIIGIML